MNNVTENKAIVIDGINKTLEVSSGSLYGDITIITILGVVLVLSIFTYGYFFGTRSAQPEILALKKENERLLKFLDK